MLKRFIAGVSLLVLFAGTGGSGSVFPEVSGWKLQVEKKVYTNSDLWQLIDGAADIFLTYSFQDLHIAEYTRKEQIIRAELYRHDSPENAYGIYTAERMPDYPQVILGSQGYKSQGILNFLAGNYYVKIMSAGSQEASEEAIALIAAKVEGHLAQPTGLPEVTGYFPKEGIELLSDSYIAQNFLGYSFLHSAFTARYQSPSDFELFIIKSTPREVQEMADRYMAAVNAENVQKKEDLFILEDPYNGRIFMKIKQGFLVGVINTDNEDIATSYIGRTMELIP
jgi:hypothetical protein